jgi:hypothetical protein
MVYHKYPMTRKLITVMAIALAFPGWAAPQISPAIPQPAEVAQQLKEVMRKWTAALVRGDVKTLGEVLDDTYLDTDEQANQSGKNATIDAVKSGELKLASLQLSNLRIHSFVYAAVVTGKGTQSGTFKGQKLAPEVTFTDTFALLNGTWKVVASHRSAPPASEK